MYLVKWDSCSDTGISPSLGRFFSRACNLDKRIDRILSDVFRLVTVVEQKDNE